MNSSTTLTSKNSTVVRIDSTTPWIPVVIHAANCMNPPVSTGYSRYCSPGFTCRYGISPSANPKWIPEIPEDQQFTFDLDKARALLDGAGVKDTNGDGIREYQGKNINLDYYILSDSQTAPGNAEFPNGGFGGSGLTPAGPGPWGP